MGVGHSLHVKSFDHVPGAMAAIHVIAQENRHRMVERPRFHIGLDALGQFPEQVVTTMNIANAIHPSPIRDTTGSLNRGRCFRNARNSGSAHRTNLVVLVPWPGWTLSQGPLPLKSRPVPTRAAHIMRAALSSGRTNRGATKRHRDRCAHHFEQHANASSVIKPLERAHEVSKGPG